MILRLTWRRVAAGLAALLLGGLLFAWSGLFNVAATGGHWAATDWLLHWVMRNSVRTHAALTVGTPPALDDRALLARGAGHYAVGCAACHGAPGEPQSPIIGRSTPAPPDFSQGIAEWQAAELFRIVQHGVRYTGMPGWIEPRRQDEIWSVVAFLRAMPGLSHQEYLRLAHGEEAPRRLASGRAGIDGLSIPGAEALSACASCHGRDGLGRDGDAFPIIAGLSEPYLLRTLQAFADGSRHSGIMQPAAARVGEAGLRTLAAHYAAQPRPASQPAAEPALMEEGAAIARDGLPGQQMPACLSCHGTGGLNRNPGRPDLRGQHASYLENQLNAWQQGARGGGGPAMVMQTIAERLSPEQVRAVSAWFASVARE
jgi:cytochrome c553